MERDEEDVVAAVARLMEASDESMTCEQAGHSVGHTCVLVSDGGIVPTDVFDTRYPALYWRGELPLSPPGRARSEFAWAYGRRGRGRAGRRRRLVVAVPEWTAPEPVDLPTEMSWVERLVAIMGGTLPVAAPDWQTVESRWARPWTAPTRATGSSARPRSSCFAR